MCYCVIFKTEDFLNVNNILESNSFAVYLFLFPLHLFNVKLELKWEQT